MNYWKKNKLDASFLLENIKQFSNFSDILAHFGLTHGGGNVNTLRMFLLEHEIDISHFSVRSHTKSLTLTSDMIFCERSTTSRGVIKAAIIRDKLIEYKCQKCKNLGVWESEKLTLQLEHKNGISNDNRLSNLEFLCPNCHSQTATYGGKSSRKNLQKAKCVDVLSAKDKKIKESISILENLQSIDFSKLGWVKEASAIIKISPQKVRSWIKMNKPDLLEKAYKRK